MNKTKYYWVVLSGDSTNIMCSVEVVGIYKYFKYAEKIAKSLPLTAIRRVPLIEDTSNETN